MRKSLSFILAGALALFGVGCGGYSPEQMEIRNLGGESKPFLSGIVDQTSPRRIYLVKNYPEKGEETSFYDIGGPGYFGDGCLDAVKINSMNGTNSYYLNRKDLRFSVFEEKFEKEIKPAAKKLGYIVK